MNEEKLILDILADNDKRTAVTYRDWNPITGEGAAGSRAEVIVDDLYPQRFLLPASMLKEKFIKKLKKHGSLKSFVENELGEEYTSKNRASIIEYFVRLRNKHDFCFWAFFLVRIKDKEPLPGTSGIIPFKLNVPQLKLVEALEEMRLAEQPMRLILLKARQWGGSTLVQMYMAWLQLCVQKGLNSLIVSHVYSSSTAVNQMFQRMLDEYPAEFLFSQGVKVAPKYKKIHRLGNSNISAVDARNVQIGIGTAQSPESARGTDVSLVHLSEVGLWKATKERKPADIVQAATSGVALAPNTLIVYESTAKGTGNFFHQEWLDAAEGRSMFRPLFVAWFEISRYRMPIEDREAFVRHLLEFKTQREAADERSESGAYLWWLWEIGASLEAINWYIHERRKYRDHGQMASEFPSDSVEAFVHSGAAVFDKYMVEELRKKCKKPTFIGEMQGEYHIGPKSLNKLKFIEDATGQLYVWHKPEKSFDERITDRYLVSVDIGGRSAGADYSVVTVFDRYWMMYGDKPVVVAQWYGHCDHDILAWKSAQIAKWYDNALLVIESNTLETKDQERDVDMDQSGFILNEIKAVYDNLYARTQKEDDVREGRPVRYGFHTNVSTKPAIIAELQRIIREQMYVERDRRCCDEFDCYEKRQNGSFSAVIGKHDDMLMSRAIGLYICFKEMPIPKIVEIEQRREQVSVRNVQTTHNNSTEAVF